MPGHFGPRSVGPIPTGCEESSDVVPANAGTHTPRRLDEAPTAATFYKQQMTGVMGPAFAGTTNSP
jgi:hypothetical protein